MIDLLYHATIYYEIRKFVQESDPNALTYEMVIEKAKAHERNVHEYKDPNSFDRLGSLKGAYNIRIDPSVKPVTHARRKVPIESKEAIDRELDYLIEEEIITEQVEPTPWVSSVTFPRKPNGDVRVCLDPSNLNKAIIRGHHKPMTVEEIAHELAGATVYTKADALKAFLQIHLTHEASLLTTFNSHRGWL